MQIVLNFPLLGKKQVQAKKLKRFSLLLKNNGLIKMAAPQIAFRIGMKMFSIKGKCPTSQRRKLQPKL